MHRDEKGRHSPAQSKIARSMNGNGHKAKKIEKMEAVRHRMPTVGEKGRGENVEKTGMYRKAYSRNIRRLTKETGIR